MLSWDEKQRRAKAHDKIYKTDEYYEKLWKETKQGESVDEFIESDFINELSKIKMPLHVSKEDTYFKEWLAKDKPIKKSTFKPGAPYTGPTRKPSSYIPRWKYEMHRENGLTKAQIDSLKTVV